MKCHSFQTGIFTITKTVSAGWPGLNLFYEILGSQHAVPNICFIPSQRTFLKTDPLYTEKYYHNVWALTSTARFLGIKQYHRLQILESLFLKEQLPSILYDLKERTVEERIHQWDGVKRGQSLKHKHITRTHQNDQIKSFQVIFCVFMFYTL